MNDLERIELAARRTAAKHQELIKVQKQPHTIIYEAFIDFADELAEQIISKRRAEQEPKPHE